MHKFARNYQCQKMVMNTVSPCGRSQSFPLSCGRPQDFLYIVWRCTYIITVRDHHVRYHGTPTGGNFLNARRGKLWERPQGETVFITIF